MSVAAQAVLIETRLQVESPLHLEAPLAAAEDALHNLLHELRQPLSSIEAIAYYMEMTLPAEQFQARQYMWRLQQLVEQANAILEQNLGTARKPCTRAHSAGAQ
jgi:signal transduction histidine kinase